MRNSIEVIHREASDKMLRKFTVRRLDKYGINSTWDVKCTEREEMPTCYGGETSKK